MKTEVSRTLKTLESILPFIGDNWDIPLRHVATLLYVLEHGETTSKELEDVFGAAQSSTNRAISNFRLRQLVSTFKGETSAHKIVAGVKGHVLKELLEKLHETP